MDYRISIIIPVGDVAPYLRQCLDSATGQTLRDIEIVCVDDASQDGSRGILEEYARRDARIRLLRHAANQSASQARKDGVLSAAGEFVMFLDGDDYLEPDACEILYGEICRRRVEILHFGAHVINAGNLPRDRVANMERFVRPCPARIEGQEVFAACFRRRQFGFTLWNKIYSADLCKRSFAHIPDGSFPKAQDLLAFFIVAFFARSYAGKEDGRHYHYRLGAGLTGHNLMSLGRFETHCAQARVSQGIRRFLEDQGVFDEYREVYRGIHDDLLFECVWNWLRHLAPRDRGRGFDMLVEAWGGDDVAACLVWRREYDMVRAALADVRRSWSFRIGSAITCVPRRLQAWAHGGRGSGVRPTAQRSADQNVRK